MHFEVEQKFPVANLALIEAQLHILGATFGAPLDQVDRYFAHPARDFATTDEALRVRRVGNENCITYKGPKLDSTTKTRREIELPLAGGEEYLARYTELLTALGFNVVAEVSKHRTPAELHWQGKNIEAALDNVTSVGTYLELEVIADEAELDEARATITSLAAKLGLSNSERRSYLELLLERMSRVADG